LRENVVFSGRIITVRADEVLLPNGARERREVVLHGGGCAVAALTAANELIFVRQYRYPYGEDVLELPAGKLEQGEDPALAIRRELLEEAGVTAQDWLPMGIFYPTPGYCAEKIYLYLARGLSFGPPQPDANEFLEQLKIPLDEAVSRVMAGEIPDGKTQALVLKTWYLLRKENTACSPCGTTRGS
jgi:ADP-ribose pyrophosphatase